MKNILEKSGKRFFSKCYPYFYFTLNPIIFYEILFKYKLCLLVEMRRNVKKESN